jgi:hypothetical protein
VPPFEAALAESALDRGLLEVRDTGDKHRGQGLFAVETLLTGTWLGNYVGEELTYKQYVARYPRGDSSYTFLISDQAQRRDRRFIDAMDAAKSNLMRYINHSKSTANVRAEVCMKPSRRKPRRRNEGVDGSEVHIRLTACKDIFKDGELLLDYGPLYTPALAWDESTDDSNSTEHHAGSSLEGDREEESTDVGSERPCQQS